MAIHKLSDSQPRNRIGFVEEEAPKDAVMELAKLCGYDLFRFEPSHLVAPTLASTAAVIFTQLATRPRKILRQLERYAGALLCHDCRVFVQPVMSRPGANGPAFRSMIVSLLNTLRLPPSGLSEEETKSFDDWFAGADVPSLTPVVHVLEGPNVWHEIALMLRNHPPGPLSLYELSVEAVDAEGRVMTLTTEQLTLVRRAFSDCASVKLIGLKNGLSDVLTFRAFAELRGGNVGSKWPYLYFVKIGERAKISREFLAYELNALENIPYHLGPSLRLERCGLGYLQGIIISDYVSGAETLRDCARAGRAVPVIANLFNSTLWAWRNSGAHEPTALQQLLLKEMPKTIPSHRKPLIETYSRSPSVERLKNKFLANPSVPVVVGVIHGDLHATNVLVRGGDAIVIDFEKIWSRGPLLWDMACLEGGLFVDGFVGDVRRGVELLQSIRCLYDAPAFDDANVIPCHPSDGSAWFFDCVRQIRMQARQVELKPRQYALTLAVALAKKGCNEYDFRYERTGDSAAADRLSREEVRALAYVLSEKILDGLLQQPPGDDA